MPVVTSNKPSVKTLNKKPEALNWIPKYGTEKTKATSKPNRF